MLSKDYFDGFWKGVPRRAYGQTPYYSPERIAGCEAKNVRVDQLEAFIKRNAWAYKLTELVAEGLDHSDTFRRKLARRIAP